MNDVLLTRDLVASGWEHDELRRLAATGEFRRLRRGAYADAHERGVYQEHEMLVRASLALAESDSVVSFGSAGVLHGLPVPRSAIERVHLTRKRSSGGRIRPGIHVHVAPLGDGEVVSIAGSPVTSLDRTFTDLARVVPLVDAVAAGDVALAKGMEPGAVGLQLEAARYRTGIRSARRAAAIIDPRSESYAESWSRLLMIENGVPAPELQVTIDGLTGFDARVDFLWEDCGVVGEFDGKIKYGRLLKPGELPGDAVFREKRREDALRELGYIVVRWIWDDLLHPPRLIARILRALDLGRSWHQHPH